VDEAYANPRNEIWLDLTTDTAGDGHARSKVDWQFPSDRRPKSVIIHERHTTLGGTTAAGTAGLRVACLNVSF
jgi:Cu-Zn family superoxide dismutase